MNHRNNFDLLRLFAACQVMVTHACMWLHLGEGWSGTFAYRLLFSFPGVAIFFVISGYLVTDSYLRSASSGSYFVKRALRIFPALFVNIVVMELALLATGGSVIVSAAKYLGYLSTYMLTGARPWGIYASSVDPYISAGFFKAVYPSGVLWTLTVELTFYLALPVVLEAYRRTKRGGIVLVAVLGVASWFMAQRYNLTDKYDQFVSVTVGPSFWIFSFGVLARLCWNRVGVLFTSKAGWWLAAHLGLAWLTATGPYAFVSINNAAPWDTLRIAVLAGLVLSAAYTFPRPQLLRGQDLSYGIYLYHMLVLHSFVAMGWIGSWSLWMLAAAATVILAATSWLLIEKPAMRLRTAFVARSASKDASAAGAA
ncbi:acyltransferase family protein [Variovorax ginsengisoli]|uniref:Acyltransferase n=1 Tax=Variovorax ginsengisoli TaxID=363844 RepID=A0ABT8SE96_9BURK|nr:acyltransferase [Variovorax ginsengisoli]MDN8617890.1 acyltransferase [Variovorax ginsengisoli]MDO1537060.1 acyltransferase [Variovorax ginsengisoli]